MHLFILIIKINTAGSTHPSSFDPGFYKSPRFPPSSTLSLIIWLAVVLIPWFLIVAAVYPTTPTETSDRSAPDLFAGSCRRVCARDRWHMSMCTAWSVGLAPRAAPPASCASSSTTRSRRCGKLRSTLGKKSQYNVRKFPFNLSLPKYR